VDLVKNSSLKLVNKRASSLIREGFLMNQHTELLIGFDARENFLSFKNLWNAQRIKGYLLRENLVKPLSVDVMVWDSIFHVLGVSIPDWVGPRQVWNNFEMLNNFIEENQVNSSYWLVGITQWMTEFEKTAFEDLYQIKLSVRSKDWKLLGFDVADYFLLSGLMNAGYSAQERKILRQLWAKYLNQYGLFEDFDTALKFKFLTDQRVKEHSPFYVYGMYLIDKLSLNDVLLE
jgi:hypothetical protein